MSVCRTFSGRSQPEHTSPFTWLHRANGMWSNSKCAVCCIVAVRIYHVLCVVVVNKSQEHVARIWFIRRMDRIKGNRFHCSIGHPNQRPQALRDAARLADSSNTHRQHKSIKLQCKPIVWTSKCVCLCGWKSAYDSSRWYLLASVREPTAHVMEAHTASSSLSRARPVEHSTGSQSARGVCNDAAGPANTHTHNARTSWTMTSSHCYSCLCHAKNSYSNYIFIYNTDEVEQENDMKWTECREWSLVLGARPFFASISKRARSMIILDGKCSHNDNRTIAFGHTGIQIAD